MENIEKIEFHPILEMMAKGGHDMPVEKEEMLEMVTIQVGFMTDGAGVRICVDGKMRDWGNHIMGEGWMEQFAHAINEYLKGNDEWMELIGGKLQEFLPKALKKAEEEMGLGL